MNNTNTTRKIYLDNIRWITVCIVVIYHVIYMFNGVQPYGVIGAFREHQLQDGFQYLVYPWFMALLFTVSGMTVRFYLERHNMKEYLRDKTRKLLVPSTIGLFVFQWILGYYNMKIGGAFNTLGEIPGPVLYIIMAISGIGVLWYIQVLWIFSMLLLLIRKNRERPHLETWRKNTGVVVTHIDNFCIWGGADSQYTNDNRLPLWNLWILLFRGIFYFFT